MPFSGGGGAGVVSSKITFDSDMTVPAAYKIKVDHIAETTASHTVVFDNDTSINLLLGVVMGRD